MTQVRANIRSQQPPPVRGLQDEYRKEVESRFRKLRGVLRETISGNDALHLGDPSRRNVDDPESEPNIEAKEEIADRGRRVLFREQLREWIDEGILEPIPREEIEQEEHYSAIFATAAYKKGLDWADSKLEDEGQSVQSPEDYAVLLNRPIHKRELESIYLEDYSDLEDVTRDMERTITRILSQGLIEGWHPRKMADKMNREIADIEHKRVRAIARTATMRSFNSGSIARYKEYGVSEFEILTHDPCEICRVKEAGDPYPVNSPERPPFHPHCECAVIPVV